MVELELGTIVTYKLVIKHGDGTEYDKIFSNTPGALEQWIAVEQTRPYWKKEYTYEITQE